MVQECFEASSFSMGCTGRQESAPGVSNLSQPLYLRLRGLAEGEEMFLVLKEQRD